MAERLTHIRKFRADVEQCMKCGFCGYFCPIYREERDEKGLARGKDELIRFVLQGEQDLTPGFYRAIDNCLLCKTCVQYCPAKTRTDHAVIAARADYAAEKGLPLAKRIVFRHLLPNCLPPLIVVATVQVAHAIALEATLSFLGLGLPVTEPSLGLLISNGFQYLLSGKYWISFYPGIALLATIMAINLVADQLRDVLNPRLRR